MKKAIIIDICDTLYNENTTIGYINFIASNEGLLEKCFKNYVVKVFFKVVYKFTHYDFIRAYHVSKLKGYKKEVLERHAETYVESLEYNKEIHDWILYARDNSIDLIFASASLEPVVKSIFIKFSAKGYCATTLRYINEISQGKIESDRLNSKSIYLSEIRSKYQHLTFISDNKGDLSCLKYCDRFLAVIPKNKKNNIKYWLDNDVKEFIKL
ncbi:hypothetical protein XV92_08830 [Vibrio metoecus]|uniref:Haloacid dehalogenase-like hydrolase n=1 Tax=Vibrio metoecus TaxID=1481663 RepID=A0A0Q0TL97_VIBMT|nr:haloacid dehalogenase-like hydrolase [Vibrio metoecus]KQB01574.1 hypothetical protein XV92_08830 [Vibrio metoecus]